MDLVVFLSVAVAVAYKYRRTGLGKMSLLNHRYPLELRAFGSIVVAYWVGGLSVVTYAAYLDSGPTPPVFPVNLSLFGIFGLIVLNGIMVFWKRSVDRSAPAS
jgi:hypothetical protein